MRIKYIITCKHLAHSKYMDMLAAIIVHPSKVVCMLAGPAGRQALTIPGGDGYVRELVEVKVLVPVLTTSCGITLSRVTAATLS